MSRAFFRRGLLDNGYVELAITSEHAVNIEGITLLTADSQLARYRGPVRKV